MAVDSRTFYEDQGSSQRLWERLAWVEPVWIALLAPSILLPGRFWIEAWQPFLVLLLFAFWPIRFLAYGRLSLRTPIDLALTVLVVWVALSVWIAVDRSLAWTAAGYLLLGVALYAALVNWPPARRRPQRIAWLLLVAGVGLALIGPVVLTDNLTRNNLLPKSIADPVIARVGETINANVLAGALLLVAPLPFALALTPAWTERRGARLLHALLGLGLTAALLMTQSRGAYLALVMGLALLLALRWPRLGALLAMSALVGMAGLVWFGPRQALEIVAADPLLGGPAGRVEIWSRAVFAVEDFGLSGIGLGQFAVVVPALYPYLILEDTIPHAHNLFLQVAVDVGLPGLVSWLAVVLGAAVMLARPLRTRPWRQPDLTSDLVAQRSLRWGLAAGGLAALTAMLVHGMVDAVTWNTKLAFVPWLLYALAAGLTLQRLRKRRRRRSSEAFGE